MLQNYTELGHLALTLPVRPQCSGAVKMDSVVMQAMSYQQDDQYFRHRSCIHAKLLLQGADHLNLVNM